MDFVCQQHSCSPSSPMTAPELSTPPTAKHKRPWRKVLINDTRRPVSKGVREPIKKKSRIWHAAAELSLLEDHAPPNFANSVDRLQSSSYQDIEGAAREIFPISCNESPVAEGSESGGFLDEEAVFNMPALLDGMAEGMLLTPFRWSEYDADDEEGIELNLWED